MSEQYTPNLAEMVHLQRTLIDSLQNQIRDLQFELSLSQPRQIAQGRPIIDNTKRKYEYSCPHCGAALTTKQAVGAAKTNGYCASCKADRKRSA